MVTVGVGIGENKEKASESIAHGIIFSIKENNPDKVFFIVSEESEKVTIPIITNKIDKISYKLVKVDDENDVNKCFKATLEAIRKAKEEGYGVTVDFTSGTKAMSAGAVTAATIELATLSYVAGERVGGRVFPGTERLEVYKPWRVVLEKQYETLANLFNHNQFKACIELINTMIDPENSERLEMYRNICNGYYQWDIFKHEEAKNILIRERKVPSGNKEFLGRLSSAEDKEVFLIADLLNNSCRRAVEGKYDDAVARLYRATELIAQYILRKEYSIDTSDLNLDEISEALKKYPNLKDELEREKDDRGRIRIGLQKSYKLLFYLKDEVGEEFINNRRIQDLLKRRNESILAHGVRPITNEDYNSLYEEVKKLCLKTFQNIEELIEKSKFPKFDVFR